MPHTIPANRDALATKCAVSGCTRSATSFPWTRCCLMHARHANRYGSPTVRATRRHELKRYREQIREVLAKYHNSAPVQAALTIADDLLNYVPRRDYTKHHRCAEQMKRLRAGGITAKDILQRVAEVWSLQMFDHRLEDRKVLDNAMARHLLQIVPQGTYRPQGTLLRYLGAMLTDDLGLFCTGVCRQITKDAETRATARKVFDRGWAIAGEA